MFQTCSSCPEREIRLQLLNTMARGGRRLTNLIYDGIRALFCPSITMLCSILIFIVNNGNIITDGRRRKKLVFYRPVWIVNIPMFYVFVQRPKSFLFKFVQVLAQFLAFFTFVTVIAATFHFNFLPQQDQSRMFPICKVIDYQARVFVVVVPVRS